MTDKPLSDERLAELNRRELYTYLLDILSDYQLPGGKLDGHRLISDLATAKMVRERRATGCPEGYAIVPVEPTPAMQNAMLEAVTDGITIDDDIHRSIRHAYRAMLAASPEVKGGA